MRRNLRRDLAYCCGLAAFFAITCARIFWYVAVFTIFLLTSSLFILYGRPATILSAFASPMPGSFIRSSLLALLRSRRAEAFAGFVAAAVLAAEPLADFSATVLDTAPLACAFSAWVVCREA